ncbi:hypothetical protein BAU15_03210 [Enterococcus sp. JM4C]|uniref:ECF transporter S component n=1 Tax=Candidatus Enterococcus huntleyi TaxID=1857217 RepID=UPI001379734D|nr:ECF transporter S component [Enterococcus sp. JM4C]KAF1295567.1 hypothetical protein BAU15_03210 [Enterococcus sp. JM4C]
MQKNWSTRRVAQLALLTAFCVVGRLLTQPIPNVQPVTAILFLITLHMGLIAAMTVGSLSILITNLYLGMGIWTIAQIATFCLLCLLLSVINKAIPLKDKLLPMLIICGCSGLLYGLLISAMLAPFWGVQAFWPYYFSGVPFDLMHGIGNIGFYLLLHIPVAYILAKRQVK